LLQPREKSAILRGMVRVRLLIFLLLALVFIGGGRGAAAPDENDAIVDQLFSAIRSGDFTGATAHFSPTVKSLLTAQGLERAWRQSYSDQGVLKSWKIVHRDAIPGGEEIAVRLAFEQSNAMATVAIAAGTSQIASLFFKPAQSNLPASSPPYADASKFRSEDVIVDSPPVHLPGTITIPNVKGPFPAAILIHGSGPHDRDETVGPNHPFKDIAEGLSSRGILVLRYDKRTFVHTVRIGSVDAETIDDAASAVDFLRSRPDVAKDRIYIIGHSLGAELAPEVAKRAWPVAGLVLLAPAGRRIEQVIVQQIRFLKQASPAELIQIERQADEITQHKMPPNENFMGAPASYFYDLDNRDEVAIARTLGIPILILHGTRDYQVTDDDIQIWQKGLKGTAKVKVEELPNLNHIFMNGQGTPNPEEYQIPSHVDVEVIKAISTFIQSR
jgi:uncharacterized protein